MHDLCRRLRAALLTDHTAWRDARATGNASWSGASVPSEGVECVPTRPQQATCTTSHLSAVVLTAVAQWPCPDHRCVALRDCRRSYSAGKLVISGIYVAAFNRAPAFAGTMTPDARVAFIAGAMRALTSALQLCGVLHCAWAGGCTTTV